MENVKILNLVLFSHGKYYDQMYQITREYYRKNENVTTIYYTFNPDIQTQYELNNDILYINGKESYLPGILKKTILAFEYVLKNLDISSYKYVIRTNISTIVDFKNLLNILEKTSTVYGGLSLKLGVIDTSCGIIDKKYFGLEYPSGTCIVLSRYLVQKIVELKDKIDYSVIDDVAIGLIVGKQLGIKLTSLSSHFVFTNITKNFLAPEYYVFRNRNHKREIDIANMKKIIAYLENKFF